MPGPTFVVGSVTYISDLNTLSNAILTQQSKSANFTAVRGFWYTLSTNALSVTLPASPAAGDLVRISPELDTILSVTFLRNGSNIDSTAADVTLSSNTSKELNVWLIYLGASVGWRIIRQTGSGGFAWGGVQTTGFTAVKNTEYGIDASTFTATLPASPSVGDMVALYATTPARTAITLGRNSSNIDSAAADYVINTTNWRVIAIYTGATVGWRLIFNYIETKKAPTISSGTLTLDCENGKTQTFDVSLNANITTLTISNPLPSGNPSSFELWFTADGTARTVTWGASVKWPGANAPTPTSTNGKVDRFLFETKDGGTNWYPTIIGQNA